MSGVISNPGTKSGLVGGFDDVENTKLSTWAGTSNITTIGTVTSGGLGTGSVIDDPTITQGSDATGDTYYRAANGKMTRLAASTDGYPLTGTGAGSVPAWEASAGEAAGAQEVSEAENTTNVTRSSMTAFNPGHYITFNPDSTSDMVFVNVTISWHDGTPNTAQGHRLYSAVGGGSYIERKLWGNHMNHTTTGGDYGMNHFEIGRTAGQWGWSTGTLQFKHYVMNQDNNNDVQFGADQGGGARTWQLQGVRYAAARVTAGTDSAYSDFRLKYNISLIQRATSSTPNLYMFKYKWDKFTNYVGVMAQELLDTSYSNAVHKESNGYYSVDYSKLGFPMMKISKALSLDKILSLTKGK